MHVLESAESCQIPEHLRHFLMDHPKVAFFSPERFGTCRFDVETSYNLMAITRHAAALTAQEKLQWVGLEPRFTAA